MWYHTNFIGSVHALTDVDQTTVETYDYDAYGIPLTAPGEAPNPFKYVGQLGYYKDPDHTPSPKHAVGVGQAESGLWRASHLMLLGARY